MWIHLIRVTIHQFYSLLNHLDFSWRWSFILERTRLISTISASKLTQNVKKFGKTDFRHSCPIYLSFQKNILLPSPSLDSKFSFILDHNFLFISIYTNTPYVLSTTLDTYPSFFPYLLRITLLHSFWSSTTNLQSHLESRFLFWTFRFLYQVLLSSFLVRLTAI